MRVLVAGGAGFVGSHLCDRLVADGHTVTCLDNLVTGSRQNVAGLAGHARFTLTARYGWEPRVNLEDGLGRTVAWFSQTSAPVSSQE